jgi:hypothetical protein
MLDPSRESCLSAMIMSKLAAIATSRELCTEIVQGEGMKQ